MNKNVRRASRPAQQCDSSPLAPKRVSPAANVPAAHHRCCYVSPDYRDFGQLVEIPSKDTRNSALDRKKFVIPETVSELDKLRKAICGDIHKVDDSSQYFDPVYTENTDGTQWQSIDNVDDIDLFLRDLKPENIPPQKSAPTNITISEVPRVKIIAEKYSKYKNNDMQLRKLEEKVVCVEYDVFEQKAVGQPRPIQVMRAFFSMKPVGDKDTPITDIPSTLKRKFKIDSETANDKELEIIDGNIVDNQPYLNDIRKILQRQQRHANRKGKNTIDLDSLYEMARKECLHFDRCGTSALSNEELLEIKELILKNCTSSVHGITRKTVKGKTNNLDQESAISESICAELLRNNATKELVN